MLVTNAKYFIVSGLEWFSRRLCPLPFQWHEDLKEKGKHRCCRLDVICFNPVSPVPALSRSHSSIPLCCLVRNPQVKARSLPMGIPHCIPKAGLLNPQCSDSSLSCDHLEGNLLYLNLTKFYKREMWELHAPSCTCSLKFL